jgi:radical SAM protein with 4Fe4S-binding SPASM domain
MGVRSISISLDGACASTHDEVRGIPGHFERTVAALEMISAMGFRLQVNTTVMNGNVTELADVAALLRRLHVPIWEVFFLVGVGRGTAVAPVSAAEAEDVCHFLADVGAYGLTVRTVEAPFYRRVQAERAEHPGEDPRAWAPLGALYERLRARLDLETPAPTPAPSATLATGDGRGVVFVGHDGEVHASGFLPLALGNVRDDSLERIYTEHPLLRAMRAGALADTCGACTYRRLCGGSRARAFAVSGEALGDDPSCVRVVPRERASVLL